MAVLQFAFPDLQSVPTLLCQSLEILAIPYLVHSKLWQPEIPVGLWDEAAFAAMGVPETAVDEYHLMSCGKNQVWFSGKIRPMKPESVAKAMHEAANCQFRQGIFAADCSHILTAIHAPSYLELLKEPIQDRALFFLSRSADL
jgi:hypothetical protein